MADDEKNIPDAGKVDESLKPEKIEPDKAAPPVLDQFATAKTEVPMVRSIIITTGRAGGLHRPP